MPKINVYLPDDLADAVRDTGVPISTICQRALELAVNRVTTIRQSTAMDLLPADNDPIGRMQLFTARCQRIIEQGIDHAHERTAPNVGTADLLGAIVAEGTNLAVQILSTLGIQPSSLTIPATASPATASPAKPEPGGAGEGLRFSDPAAIALELAVAEATALGHNYVGTEHILIALATEPDGAAGKALREAGADAKTLRRTVVAALAGYKYLQAQSAPAKQMGALMAAVRQELQPLVHRIERLETRLA
jgi:ATP-dependent Clp protease ATP-binding subunit ClpA